MPLNQMPVKQKSRLLTRAVTALLLTLLASACASKSPSSLPPPSVNPVQPPALTPAARQIPQDQLPSICLPSCTQGLTRLREQSLQSLTMQESVVLPANGSMIR